MSENIVKGFLMVLYFCASACEMMGEQADSLLNTNDILQP